MWGLDQGARRGSVEHAEEGTRSLQSTGGEPDEQ